MHGWRPLAHTGGWSAILPQVFGIKIASPALPVAKIAKPFAVSRSWLLCSPGSAIPIVKKSDAGVASRTKDRNSARISRKVLNWLLAATRADGPNACTIHAAIASSAAEPINPISGAKLADSCLNSILLGAARLETVRWSDSTLASRSLIVSRFRRAGTAKSYRAVLTNIVLRTRGFAKKKPITRLWLAGTT